MKTETTKNIKTFQRKTHIWFGTEGEHFSLDFIWKFPLQMYLGGDTLYLEQTDTQAVLNGKAIAGTKLEIKEGDVFGLDGLSITFLRTSWKSWQRKSCTRRRFCR